MKKSLVYFIASILFLSLITNAYVAYGVTYSYYEFPDYNVSIEVNQDWEVLDAIDKIEFPARTYYTSFTNSFEEWDVWVELAIIHNIGDSIDTTDIDQVYNYFKEYELEWCQDTQANPEWDEYGWITCLEMNFPKQPIEITVDGRQAFQIYYEWKEDWLEEDGYKEITDYQYWANLIPYENDIILVDGETWTDAIIQDEGLEFDKNYDLNTQKDDILYSINSFKIVNDGEQVFEDESIVGSQPPSIPPPTFELPSNITFKNYEISKYNVGIEIDQNWAIDDHKDLSEWPERTYYTDWTINLRDWDVWVGIAIIHDVGDTIDLTNMQEVYEYFKDYELAWCAETQINPWFDEDGFITCLQMDFPKQPIEITVDGRQAYQISYEWVEEWEQNPQYKEISNVNYWANLIPYGNDIILVDGEFWVDREIHDILEGAPYTVQGNPEWKAPLIYSINSFKILNDGEGVFEEDAPIIEPLIAEELEITVFTDKESYEQGSSIKISGQAPEKSSEVILALSASDKTMVYEITISSNEEGEFLTFHSLPDDLEDGTYTITATQIDVKDSTTFVILPPEPVVEPELEEETCDDPYNCITEPIEEEVAEPVKEDLTEAPPPKTIPEPKLETQIYEIKKSDKPQEYAKTHGIQFEENKVKVILDVSSLPPAIMASLEDLVEVNTVQKNQLLIDVEIDKIDQVLELAQVKSIRTPSPPVVNQAAVISEGVVYINSDLAQIQGLSGKGVSVGVLDLGFDVTNSEILDNIVESKSFRHGFGSKMLPIKGFGNEYVHGTAVAEIIVDTAPGVDLFLFSIGNELEFEEALDYAMTKVDLMVTSTGWLKYSTDGTTPVTQKVEDLIEIGIPFVVSSSNYARSHWEGDFIDSNLNGWHDFSAGDDALTIKVTEKRVQREIPIIVNLLWYDNDSTILSDFNLALFDLEGNQIAYSGNQNTGIENAYESIHYVPTNPGIYSIGISFDGNTASDDTVEIFTPHDRLEYHTKQGSVIVPTDAVGVIIVGAVDYSDGSIKSYSSQGPTNHQRLAPIVMGPDCVTTLSMSKAFCGTSAAAPHVGGIVALMLEDIPGATPNEIVFALQEFANKDAVSLNEPFNNVFGYGLADASFLLKEEQVSAVTESELEFEEREELVPQLRDDQVEQQAIQVEPPQGGGCLIATATFDSVLSPQVQLLREVRDNTLLSTTSGTSFMTGFNQLYYSFSPTIADWERQNPIFKESVKLFITPMLSTLSIMTFANDGSETQVLGLGISVIALNLGMYIVAPVVVALKVRNHLKSRK